MADEVHLPGDSCRGARYVTSPQSHTHTLCCIALFTLLLESPISRSSSNKPCPPYCTYPHTITAVTNSQVHTSHHHTCHTLTGMIGAMTRHLKSLRYMQRDHGWIHTLLEEAENERMHLLTFLELRKPGPLFKAMVVCGQGVCGSMASVYRVYV